MLDSAFGKSDKLDLKGFLNVVENLNSDMFLYIIIFLLEKKPFTKETLKNYEVSKSPTLPGAAKLSKSPSLAPSKLIASPNLQSKFSPTVAISKSPTITRKNFGIDPKSEAQKDLLAKLGGKKTENPLEKKNVLLQYTASNIAKPLKIEEVDENVSAMNIPAIRKNRNNLKNIENMDPNLNQNSFARKNLNSDENDFTLGGAFKVKTNAPKLSKEDLSSQLNQLSITKGDEDDDSDDEAEVKFEGNLYKITDTKKLKMLWFKLINKDLYYYRSKEETTHKGMHHLSGVFVKEETPITYEGKHLYAFSVVYPKKVRYYYSEDITEYQKWLSAFRKATGYADLTDIYEVREKLGNGKFGLVKLGIHKSSGRKVAIKMMKKKDMSSQDLELVRTEVEILKICQHPGIIRILDIYENLEHMYIVMEYCSGGDMFTYIEKRKFKLSEERAATLIHEVLAAVYYLHSYGITHRDLKPENMLMTDNTETASLKLTDFGLSKIIGPNETCNEPYGTLSYVAPEVLLEKRYTKSVDMWSIGIISYLLLVGILPFDHETSEREIARQTVHNPTPFPSSLWKKISAEARLFVDNLLQKEPTKRMTIKDALEHPWIQKHSKSNLPEIRRQSKEIKKSDFTIYSSAELKK